MDEAEKKRLTQFTKVVGHELKHPLTSLKAYLYLLKSNIKKTVDDPKALRSFEQYLDKADRQIDVLTAMLNNLSDSSKVTLGQLQIDPEPVKLFQLVKTILDEMRTMYPAVKMNFVVDEDECSLKQAKKLTVLVDPIRFRQVIVNILLNAISLQTKSGQVLVIFTRDAQKAKLILIDSGPGIAETDLPHVFEPYFQAQQVGRAHKGLGLGLFISQEIMRKHHGKITAENFSAKLDLQAKLHHMINSTHKPQGTLKSLDKTNWGAVFTIHVPISSADPRQ